MGQIFHGIFSIIMVVLGLAGFVTFLISALLLPISIILGYVQKKWKFAKIVAISFGGGLGLIILVLMIWGVYTLINPEAAQTIPQF